MRTVPEEASSLLEKHSGIQRNAEAEAWEIQAQWKPSSEVWKFWGAVALAIVEGEEYPKVPRAAYVPTPSFKPLALTP